ncbi:MAG TPA: pyrroline-5-carboxylate reductase dimerization domain-containing protein [Allosphingosinicella sp.]|uniref:pyrroline-5-carboxylate reductase family protein n=1 Tax=Allosphingosinicella sp. TaxID=2823234 RepID=UPI002ED7C25F
MTMPPLPGPFWLVGCGNMAGAMLARWLDCGIDRSRLTVIRPSGQPVAEGVRVLTAYPEGEAPALVMLGTKPQKLNEVAPGLSPILNAETVLISIMAGVEQASLKARFPAVRTIVKAMPNTPVRLGKGVINLYSDGGEAEARSLVAGLMGALGRVEWFEDEPQFQAAGILTGAGPAFLFRYIDALAKAGAAIGLDAAQAARLAEAMVEGAAALAAAEEESPHQLAERVASPGGTTRAGLNVLDADEALNRLVQVTLEASLRRSHQMAEAARARE